LLNPIIVCCADIYPEVNLNLSALELNLDKKQVRKILQINL